MYISTNLGHSYEHFVLQRIQAQVVRNIDGYNQYDDNLWLNILGHSGSKPAWMMGSHAIFWVFWVFHAPQTRCGGRVWSRNAAYYESWSDLWFQAGHHSNWITRVLKITDVYRQWKYSGAKGVGDIMIKYRKCSGRKTLMLMTNVFGFAHIDEAQHCLTDVYIIYLKNRRHKKYIFRFTAQIINCTRIFIAWLTGGWPIPGKSSSVLWQQNSICLS